MTFLVYKLAYTWLQYARVVILLVNLSTHYYTAVILFTILTSEFIFFPLLKGPNIITTFILRYVHN